MTESNQYFRMEWQRTKEKLIVSLRKLGYPAALGDEIAKNLGSPKAIGVARAPRPNKRGTCAFLAHEMRHRARKQNV